MVALPRNQRYLQPVTARRDGLLVARAERKNACETAGKLDLEMSVLWQKADLVDELAQGLVIATGTSEQPGEAVQVQTRP